MRTDKTMTSLLRKYLQENNISGIYNYEWYKGEALYRGSPIWGRATPSERNAIMRVARHVTHD